MPTDLSFCRSEFPSLGVSVNGHPAAYFDGPGGTQVPRRVMDAMIDYYSRMNANIHGLFKNSQETDALIDRARQALADLLNAPSPRQIAFGQNMTTINFNLSRAIGRTIKPGDEVIVTELDHDANVAPWLALEEQGAVIKWVKVKTDTCTLDFADLEQKLSPRTRVVAMGHASNATGTVNDVKRATELAHSVGALMVVDAVHSTPHRVIDVQEIGCDFLLCSVYKFFGPHGVGVLYGKQEAFAALRTYKVRPQDEVPPTKFETGTLNHEGLAGAIAAVEFIADLGRRVRGGSAPLAPEGTPERRAQLVAGMEAIAEHEQPLVRMLLDGLGQVPGLRIYGPPAGHPRTPTVSFTLEGHRAPEIARTLGEQGLFVWDGDFYAKTVVEMLGLNERYGGLLRIGLAPYNTADEVSRLIKAVAALV